LLTGSIADKRADLSFACRLAAELSKFISDIALPFAKQLQPGSYFRHELLASPIVSAITQGHHDLVRSSPVAVFSDRFGAA
jgi:hypothetical protein